MNKDIEQALTHLRLNSERYAKNERYYNGDHDLKFATEKFVNTFGTLFREFALNLCPVICDAVKDKLRVTGFSVDSVSSPRVNKGNANFYGASGHLGATDAKEALTYVRATDTHARSIWHRNRMGTRAGEIHKESRKCGDAYMIVWPNERGEAVLYPNRAANITVVYDEDSQGRIAWAAKTWLTVDKYVRLNMFYPDRIEKYISRNKSEGAPPDAAGFTPLGSPRSKVQCPKSSDPKLWTLDLGLWTVPNPYGVVPVFHFANNADLGTHGRSELEAAIPVQDGLNKSVLDMLVAMEFAAYRQRWAAGIEVEYDAEGKAVQPFTAGAESLWIAGNPNAKFGDFDTAQLDQFLKVKDSFRLDMASVSGTPLHYFVQTGGGFPSGESLKKAETRFLAKIRDRQESFGQVWSDALSFALMIEGKGKDIRLLTEWEDPAPMAEKEVLENILLKKQIGLPVRDALLEAGYGEADVARMVKDSGVE